MALDSVHEYCTLYNLTVNTSKTKIMVFSRGKVKRYPIFPYGDDIIEVVSDYVYLGVTMNYNNEFVKAMRNQLDQGRKEQFSMLIKCRKLELPRDIQCKLFEFMVIPVILHGCEIWGFQDIKMLEILYIKFLKKVLKLRPSTSNCMVYGEVGKLPLQISGDKQLISYWLRILDKDKNTLAYITYIIVLNLFMRNQYKAHFLIRVNHILNNCGLSYMWLNQQTLHTNSASS